MERAPLIGDHHVIAHGICEYLSVTPMTKLRVAKWEGGTRGTIHIFNGRTEYIEKYYDLIEGFLTRGFNVTAHDWRGQGFSTRNELYPKRCHIEDFAFHQNDARAVIAHYSNLTGPHFLFCHSMGGAIGARYMVENPAIKACIFSAPMLGIKLPSYLQFILPYTMKIVKKMGWMWSVAAGTKEVNYETYTSFQKNQLTSNPNSWKKLVDNIDKYEEFHCGGPTYYWAEAAYGEMDALKELPQSPTPALVMLGSDEDIVDPQAIRDKIAANPNWRLVEFEGAKHEVYLERPEIVKKMWLNIDMFIDQFA